MIRTDYIRIYKSVHTWTGILSGMALFIAFYAGALTLFKEPLAAWASPPAPTRTVALEQAPELIARTLAAHPGAARSFSIHLAPAGQIPARMEWHVRAPGADDHDDTQTRHYLASFDTQGQLAVAEHAPSTLGTLIDTLHRVVGLPFDNDPARWFMGIIAILYALALFSGMVVALPTLFKDFFALRVGKNLKRMWLDAHNVIGIVSLPFHIIMAVTAVVFAFHDQIYDIQDTLVHRGKWASAFQRPHQTPPTAPPRNPASMKSPAELVAIAHRAAPGFQPYQIEYQQALAPRAVARVWGSDAAAVQPRARGGFVAIDPYSGKILNTDFLPGRQSGPSLLISSAFALHMAAFGGALVQWLYFLLALAGAWLFYSGNLLWIESRRRRALQAGPPAPSQRLAARLMAATTAGVCLGSVAGISLTIVGARWLHGHVVNLDGWLHGLYYASFFGALGWALLRGGARASIHLLWLAALLTLAIPATSLLAGLFPAFAPPAHTDLGASVIDATALAMALGFAVMARAATRRMRNEVVDSVWSIRGA